jgi:undecaprenyl diphosphate synthase
LYVTPTYWPDFGEEELRKAVESFSGRERRFGGLNELKNAENASKTRKK